MIVHNNRKYVCILDMSMDFIRGKWKAVLLCHMYEGPQRFLELQRITKGVSHKVLTEKLKELEDDELIIKTVFPELPPRVEYSLTEKGRELTAILKNVESWGLKYYSDKI